jgi:hypothetical protein
MYILDTRFDTTARARWVSPSDSVPFETRLHLPASGATRFGSTPRTPRPVAATFGPDTRADRLPDSFAVSTTAGVTSEGGA